MAQPSSPAEATRKIRACAQDRNLDLFQTAHVKERMAERGLIMGDITHLLKFGDGLNEAEKSTRPGFWKYTIFGKTPNSGSRQLGLTLIPDFKRKQIKLVTIFWKD